MTESIALTRIKELEQKINRLIETVGTGLELEAENPEDEAKAAENGKPAEETPAKNHNIGSIINLMRTTRENLLEMNPELKNYYTKIQANQNMIQNFTTYANVSLNIRDKTRALFHVKNEIDDMRKKIENLENVKQQIENINSMQLTLSAKPSISKIERLNKIVMRAEQQNKDVTALLDVYAEVIEVINEKLISVYSTKVKA